jgi:outer membrane autotransporter protein
VSLYAALPAMATIYGREVLGTYHERMGALPWPEDFAEAPHAAIWARMIGYDGHKDAEGDAENILGSPSFDLTFGTVQVGTDLHRAEGGNGQRDRAGAYFAFGRADASVEHQQGSHRVDGGDTKFDAVSLGGYWTRTGANDWYLDGVLQATWYDVHMSSHRGVGDGDTTGWGLAVSGEGGYPFAFDDGWVVEPQAQLVYQTFSFDDFDDLAAEVSYSDTDSLAGRVGARLARSWEAGTAGDPQPATVWARVNLWHEFLENATTTFSAFGGSVPFTGSLDDSWGEIEIGADMKARAEAWSFYGNLSYQVTFDGDADSFGAETGLKWRW